MASAKGCQQPTDGKYWLPDVQEAAKNFLSRASIRINSLKFAFGEPCAIQVYDSSLKKIR